MNWPGSERLPKSIVTRSSGTMANTRVEPGLRSAQSVRTGSSSAMVAREVNRPSKWQPERTAWSAVCALSTATC